MLSVHFGCLGVKVHTKYVKCWGVKIKNTKIFILFADAFSALPFLIPTHRYLLQVMLEACCLEWAMLLAVILRDAMAVVRTVNTASLTETPIEIVGRMREGISFLELWADTEW